MERFKTIFLALLILIATVPVCQNIIVSNEYAVTFPFEMPYKTFQLEVLNYNCGLIDYGGAKYLNLSMAVSSVPMGIIYDSNKNVVYMALYPWDMWDPNLVYGIVEVDITTKNLRIYRFPNDVIIYPWCLAINDAGNLWIAIRMGCYLAKLDTETANLTLYSTLQEMGSGCDIKYYDGYIWYMTDYGLSRISLDGVIEGFYPKEFLGGFMELDSNCIWLSSVMYGFVTRFNITSKSFDVNITGLDRPLGIETDENYVYVAENSRLSDPEEVKYGTIAVIDKKDFTIKERKQTAQITNEGPYHVLKDSFGNLWWTDNSKHFGVFDITGKLTVYDAINTCCYFMCETPNTIWFSVKGSAYVGIVPIPLPITAKGPYYKGMINAVKYWIVATPNHKPVRVIELCY